MSTPDAPPKLLRKTLCDWSKRDLREEFELLRKVVASPRHVCQKCGRAAAGKKWLCKPRPLDTAAG